MRPKKEEKPFTVSSVTPSPLASNAISESASVLPFAVAVSSRNAREVVVELRLMASWPVVTIDAVAVVRPRSWSQSSIVAATSVMVHGPRLA